VGSKTKTADDPVVALLYSTLFSCSVVTNKTQSVFSANRDWCSAGAASSSFPGGMHAPLERRMWIALNCLDYKMHGMKRAESRKKKENDKKYHLAKDQR
jgi:hypothetical protein